MTVLFNKCYVLCRLGFSETHYVAAFQEYEYQLRVDEPAMQDILQEIEALNPFQSYPR